MQANLIEINGRVVLPFDNTDRGIKAHNSITAFFVRLFGSGIVTFKQEDGTTFYFNKSSLVKWINCKLDGYTKPLCRSPMAPLNLKDSIDEITERLKITLKEAHEYYTDYQKAMIRFLWSKQ